MRKLILIKSAEYLTLLLKGEYMIRINNIKLGIDCGDLTDEAARILKIKKENIKELKIRRKSLDARKKVNIHYLYSVDVSVKDEEKLLRKKQMPSD